MAAASTARIIDKPPKPAWLHGEFPEMLNFS
jgi:hypothetical protein